MFGAFIRTDDMRRLLVVLTVLVAAMALAPTARAGTGPSQECTNGITYWAGMEVPLINTPITLNLEGGTSGDLFHLIVCYSTTPNGDPGPALAGGSVWFAGENDNLICRQDANTTVGVGCVVGWGGGIVVIASPRVQSTNLPIGLSVSAVEAPACVRDLVLYTPTGATGPFDIGVCA